MIYLTFDSNIWIYLLDESWKEDNSIDYLKYWLTKGDIKILLPSIIHSEWDRNKEKEKENRKRKLKDFFSMAEEILPSSFFNNYKNPSKQSEIIELQFKIIENILYTENTKIIEISQAIKNEAIERSLKKQVPMHKNKNSIADTLIILSLLEFVRNNPSYQYIFLSENIDDFFEVDTKEGPKEKEIIESWEYYKKELVELKNIDSLMTSFFDKNHKIHTDLKIAFSQFNFKEFRKLSALIGYLKQELSPIDVDLIKNLRRSRIKNTVKETIYNPEYENLVKHLPSKDYIENIQQLDSILQKSNPKQEEAKIVLGLINSDESYKEYFFKNVSSSVWYKILKDQDVFNPQNNPSPIKVKDGYQIHFWYPLLYLEKISEKIKEGKELELVDEIISVIKDISENPKNNRSTWASLIKILTNIPNEKVSNEILNFIPVWLESNFDTIFQSAELCNNLLPKFLSEKPTEQDIQKAEIIIKYLFEIKKIEIDKNETFFSAKARSYRSKIDMYCLENTFLYNKEIISKVAIHCSNEIIVYLADNLKKLHFDFPEGIDVSISINDKSFNVNCIIEDKNIIVSVSEDKNIDTIIGQKNLFNFESYDKREIKEKIIEILKKLKLDYTPSEDNEYKLIYFVGTLINGSHSLFNNNPISRLSTEEEIVNIFSLIFRDLLNQKVKQNYEEGIKLLNLFLIDKYYQLMIFRRVTFYVIGENWKLTKSLFWQQFEQYLSNYDFYKDLYEVLNKNQEFLDSNEIEKLQNIIDNLSEDTENNESANNSDYLKFRWYAALRNIEPFKSSYEQVSKSQNLTYKHYENLGEVTIRSGLVSPFSFEEILQKTNKEIVTYIQNFKPKDRWEEPTIEGLSDTLKKAVENHPEKFANEIELYKDIYYIYAYYILNGFREAWKNKRFFNWENVLNFIKDYITNSKFYSGQLSLENDGWKATPDWVIRSIGDLLTEGLQSDNNAFDLELLPIAKEIIKIIVPTLKPVDVFNHTNQNYPTYLFNSTAGKILRALFYYSFRRARNLKEEDDLPKWEKDIVTLFEDTFEKKIIDGYILVGLYFPQFYFLDKEWAINQVNKNYELEDEYWLAFLSGFAFSNLIFDKDIYSLFYPHCERAVKNSVKTKNFYDDGGIVRNILTFYFWEFEDLKDDGLLLMFINNAESPSIVELINFVWRQNEHFGNLRTEQVIKLEELIFNLWNHIANKYENPKDEEEQKILAKLSKLLVFANELDEKYTKLVLKSSFLLKEHYDFYYLIQNLTNLIKRSKSVELSNNIGRILESVPSQEYFSATDTQNMIDLITFLYENNQKSIADELCNKITKQRYNFLINLYNRYNDYS